MIGCGGIWEGLHARFGNGPLVHVITFHDTGNLVVTACDEMAFPNHAHVTKEEVDCMSCVVREAQS